MRLVDGKHNSGGVSIRMFYLMLVSLFCLPYTWFVCCVPSVCRVYAAIMEGREDI